MGIFPRKQIIDMYSLSIQTKKLGIHKKEEIVLGVVKTAPLHGSCVPQPPFLEFSAPCNIIENQEKIMEEMIRYVAETQRMMADTIVQLSEIQSRQQEIQSRQQTEIERHTREMEKLTERQSETDQRFNILLDEVRFLSRRGNEPDQPLT
jgi:vacuolar-type H+-ATPase catalytic subunit A/Vma1